MEEEKNTAAAVEWQEAPKGAKKPAAKRPRKKAAAKPKKKAADNEPIEPVKEKAPADAPKPAAEAAPAQPETPPVSEPVPAEVPAPAQPEPAAETPETAPETISEVPETAEPAEPAEAPETAGTAPDAAGEPAPAPSETAPEAPADTDAAQPESVPAAEPETPDVHDPAALDAYEFAADREDAPADAEDTDEAAADAESPDEDTDAEDEAADTPENRERAANISRTAQLSIAQIMAGLEEDTAPQPAEQPAAPQPDTSDTSDSDDGDDEPEDTITQKLGRGAFGMVKWLLLVVLFVAIIAGGGVAWLYRSATPDMLPDIKVTFDGQELAPNAYRWHVPVVGSFFKRTYAETVNPAPTELTDAVSGASPDVVVTPSGYATQLTVTDAAGETLYDGSVTGFRSYLFTENGTFDAKLVVTADEHASDDTSSVTGTETWQFRFTVSIKPSVQLCTASVQQGSVAAVRVGTTLSGDAPTLKTDLENTGFFKAANGWICYVPIPWNAETGDTDLVVTADGYTETLTLSVRAASYTYKDYSSKSKMTSPYIGENDAPDAVRKLFATADDTLQWTTGGFVQPFLDSFDTPLLYGMTEYAGRAYSERSTNYGYGGRTSTNLVIKPKKSKVSMIAPASGRVLLAEDLGDIYGNTVVIEHGAGLKSIFYGLADLDVKTGDKVKQGQLLGAGGKTVVAEMRLGTVPIDPLAVWRGQCDGLKNY